METYLCQAVGANKKVYQHKEGTELSHSYHFILLVLLELSVDFGLFLWLKP